MSLFGLAVCALNGYFEPNVWKDEMLYLLMARSYHHSKCSMLSALLVQNGYFMLHDD